MRRQDCIRSDSCAFGPNCKLRFIGLHMFSDSDIRGEEFVFVDQLDFLMTSSHE